MSGAECLLDTNQNPTDLMFKLEREKNNFSLNLILCSIRYYLECIESLGRRFIFDSVIQQCQRSFIEITTMAEEVVSGGGINTPIDNWLVKPQQAHPTKQNVTRH